ncbi:MAG: universal stress protein [Polyangiaceae bacterium]
MDIRRRDGRRLPRSHPGALAALGADAIVMGTHGRTGVRRLLLGSVAERVLRRAKVPVIVVRDPDQDHDEHLREEDQVQAEEQG